MSDLLSDLLTPAAGIRPVAPGIRRLFVRDLVLRARIGIYDHEKADAQRVRVNLDLEVDDDGRPAADRIDHVVSYEPLVLAAREIAAEGHIELLETLAERLAAECLADPRVRLARVRVEKLDVFADAQSVGIEIERMRQDTTGAGSTAP